MIFVYNLDKLSPDYYKMPANALTTATPDNIAYVQLRYNNFSSSYVIQGSFVALNNSTVEFIVSDSLAFNVFKMFTSTDGVSYTENKTFGGTNGRNIKFTKKEYAVTISQSGTSAPTIDKSHINTTGATFTLAYLDVGSYRLRCSTSTLWDDETVIVYIDPISFFQGGFSILGYVIIDRLNITFTDILIYTINPAGDISDNMLDSVLLRIEVP